MSQTIRGTPDTELEERLGRGERYAASPRHEPVSRGSVWDEPYSDVAGETCALSGPDPLWVKLSLILLLAVTAVMYLWNLAASGWANAFYSAAVQAATRSWTAFFFGSFDSSNFITVDKPPASLWGMALSARAFGLSAWSILVPQALEGVAAVWLLYLTVRRWFPAAAGLLAGAVLATAPVSALMFRYNNPDALLVLLLVASAYAMTRAIEDGATHWLLLAAVLIGFGFLTKMLQAFLVLPPFALTYLVAAPVSLRRRLGQLILSALTVILAAGWWVAAVTLVPATSRPYIGGSQDNSLLNLIFGYNGVGRLTGVEAGSVGSRGPGTGRWGETGLTRLFDHAMGGQIAWLLPAALLGLAAVLWLTRRAPRTDRARAAALLWGGWLLVTGLTFSVAHGIIHPYYTVALAPAIGALVGISAVTLWARRDSVPARLMLAAGVALTAAWSYSLLARTPRWHPSLRVWVLALGLGASLALVLAGMRSVRWLSTAAALAALVASLAGPAAYAVQTAATPHSGALPSAGPTAARRARLRAPATLARRAPAGTGGRTRAWFGPRAIRPGGLASPRAAWGGRATGSGVGWSGLGGLLQAGRPDRELVRALQQDSAEFRWVAATVGANNAAGLQLAAGKPVMAIGGFNGTDPAPTLAEFQALVGRREIHYLATGGGPAGRHPMGGSSGTAGEIVRWVEASFAPHTVGNATLYDLTAPMTGTGDQSHP